MTLPFNYRPGRDASAQRDAQEREPGVYADSAEPASSGHNVLADLEAALLTEIRRANQLDDTTAHERREPRLEPIVRPASVAPEAPELPRIQGTARQSPREAGDRAVSRGTPEPADAAARDVRPTTLDQLAAQLRLRQAEREHRYQDASDSEPIVYPEAQPEERPDAQIDGERFGWDDRFSGEDVQRYLHAQDEPVGPRRMRARTMLLGAGAVVALSAASALFIVLYGDASSPAVETEVVASGMLAESTSQADQLAREDVPAASQQVRDDTDQGAPAATGSAPQLQFQSDGVRTVRPETDRVVVPQDGQPAVTGTSGASDSLAQLDPPRVASSAPAVRQVGPVPSWVAPVAAPQAEAEVDAPGEAATDGAVPTEEADEASEQVAIGEPSQPAQTTSAVNMRAEPDNDGSVLTVIPEDATVELIGCNIWCEVVYENQQGWVYRDFVASAE